MSEVSRAEAFRIYTRNGGNMNGLLKTLKAQGKAISKGTLAKWRAEDGWDEKLAADGVKLSDAEQEVRAKARDLAVIGDQLAEVLTDEEKVRSTVASLAHMTSAISHVVEVHLKRFAADDLTLDNVLSLARAGTDIAKVLGTILKPDQAERQMKDVTPAASMVGARIADEVIEAFANPPTTR